MILSWWGSATCRSIRSWLRCPQEGTQVYRQTTVSFGCNLVHWRSRKGDKLKNWRGPNSQWLNVTFFCKSTDPYLRMPSLCHLSISPAISFRDAKCIRIHHLSRVGSIEGGQSMYVYYAACKTAHRIKNWKELKGDVERVSESPLSGIFCSIHFIRRRFQVKLDRYSNEFKPTNTPPSMHIVLTWLVWNRRKFVQFMLFNFFSLFVEIVIPLRILFKD